MMDHRIYCLCSASGEGVRREDHWPSNFFSFLRAAKQLYESQRKGEGSAYQIVRNQSMTTNFDKNLVRDYQARIIMYELGEDLDVAWGLTSLQAFQKRPQGLPSIQRLMSGQAAASISSSSQHSPSESCNFTLGCDVRGCLGSLEVNAAKLPSCHTSGFIPTPLREGFTDAPAQIIPTNLPSSR